MKEEFSATYGLERGVVNIFGTIDTEMAHAVIMQLQYLDDKFRKAKTPLEERVITLQINSPGGSVSDGLAIYDAMNCVTSKVATVGMGMAASMGAFLLAAGEKGMRSATANCEIRIHQPLGGASGQASDIIIAANHIKRTRERLNRILAAKTGRPFEEIERDTDRDNIMDAQEALAYGLIDGVLNGNKEDRI